MGLEIRMCFCECVSECVSMNVSVAFGVLTRNKTWPHYQLPVFQKLLEMSIKGVRVRYVDFLTLMIIFKGHVNVN